MRRLPLLWMRSCNAYAPQVWATLTGVLHPATASHREMAPKRRLQLGSTDGLVRISVGIEDIADIIEDIQQHWRKVLKSVNEDRGQCDASLC